VQSATSIAQPQSLAQPQQRPALWWALSDTWELFKRSVTHIRRAPGQLVMFVILQPVLLIVLFRYVFGGAVRTGGLSYADFLIPGVIATNCVFVATVAAVSVADDMTSGSIDRFRSLPMTRTSILGGAVLANLVRSVAALPVMVLFGVLVGFRPGGSVGGWVAVVALLMLASYAFSWLMAAFGVVAGSVEAAQNMSAVIWPFTFISSAFVPSQSMPGGLEWFANNQPITQLIDATRALMLGEPVGDHAWISIVWCLGIVAVGIVLSQVLLRRKFDE
jgi:ABC-2 type transport system permease protein